LTGAVALAGLAGVVAAAGVVELAGSGPLRRPGSRRRGSTGRSGGSAHASAGPGDSRSPALAVLTSVGRALGVPDAPRDLDSRLAAAGLSTRISGSEVMALKTGAALVAVLAAVSFASALPGRLGIASILAAPCGAFLAPDAWLRRRTAARSAAMALELADVLDLLRVALGAGMPPTRALAEVGKRHPGLLARELRGTAAQIELGVPQAQAFEELVGRCPPAPVEALVAALGRASRHGAALGPALTALAAQARADRARELSERAARAAPKIQLAVALGLVPGVLLLVAAVLVAALT
jgi:tight adherence protein C